MNRRAVRQYFQQDMPYNLFDQVDWGQAIANESKTPIRDPEAHVPFEFTAFEMPGKKKSKRPKGYAIPKEDLDNPLTIVPFKTNKKKIKLTPLMESDIIPRHASAVIFNGKSGSGKSNLMVNLLTRPHFYKGYFDLIFLFSPTANSDDLPIYLDLPAKRIFSTFDTKVLDHIILTQQALIEKDGIVKSPKILLIFDDIISDAKFMKSKSFMKCFIQCRHLNISTFILSQSWTKVPRVCRLQANNIFMFPSSASEVKLLCEEFCPAHTTQQDFKKIIEEATRERHNFLHINNRCGPDTRFRHNLDTYLTVGSH